MSAWRRNAIKALPDLRLVIDKAKSFLSLYQQLSTILLERVTGDRVDERFVERCFKYLFQWKECTKDPSFIRATNSEFIRSRLHLWIYESDFPLIEAVLFSPERHLMSEIRCKFYERMVTDLQEPGRAALYKLHNDLLLIASPLEQEHIENTWLGVLDLVEVGEFFIALEHFHSNLYEFFEELSDEQLFHIRNAFDFFKESFPD